jgi:hypothetical protein
MVGQGGNVRRMDGWQGRRGTCEFDGNLNLRGVGMWLVPDGFGSAAAADDGDEI